MKRSVAAVPKSLEFEVNSFYIHAALEGGKILVRVWSELSCLMFEGVVKESDLDQHCKLLFRDV